MHKATGEVVESYTMLTLNADHHPLMRWMHKPDQKLGPEAQDKRSVVPIELEDDYLGLHSTPSRPARSRSWRRPTRSTPNRT